MTYVFAVALAIAVTVLGCGRTQLDPAEPCDPDTDTTRPCAGYCGAGTQTCDAGDGTWHACEVPVVTRPCANDCGDGTESCFDKQWHTCEVPMVTRTCSTVCGDGHESCALGTWGACDAPQPKPPKLTTTVRDFDAHHPPDFERDDIMGNNDDLGIVEPLLGADNTPVYAGNPTTPTTSGAMNFHDWYHTSQASPPVNMSTQISLPLTLAAGSPDFYVYNNQAFFPIDDRLFGNEGRAHNYHFTLEAHTTFRYRGGEIFQFAGDDDTWVFINRRIAINLGGVHTTESQTVNLDSRAGDLGIVVGERYQLDIFFAERHTVSSTFMIRTSIADASACE